MYDEKDTSSYARVEVRIGVSVRGGIDGVDTHLDEYCKWLACKLTAPVRVSDDVQWGRKRKRYEILYDRIAHLIRVIQVYGNGVEYRLECQMAFIVLTAEREELADYLDFSVELDFSED